MNNQVRRTLQVFVVDDENVICTTLAMILRKMGIDAVAFERPLDALAAAKLQAPDLLLSDVAMPIMTGIELAIQLKTYCPDCKVLLFSGQASTADWLNVAKADGHSFEILTKPVHPTELLAKIHAMAPESISA
jgi:CheY-like chemotaxis protein